ncbi:MAG: acyl-CoA reductase [Capsulimonadaceae bacterium]|nr:acyl-CoA reductase [Capsulimonadaceae bacterium]
MEPSVIDNAAAGLRARRRDLAAVYGLMGLQMRAIDAIDEVAALWRDPGYAGRGAAARDSGAFPIEMVDVSLQGLLPSLTAQKLRALVREESPDLARAPEVIGHVLASNTPLLGWTTTLRALLVGSASLVKLPSSAEAAWLRLLARSLNEVAPEIAGLIDMLSWTGGNARLDRTLACSTDKLVVYGSDTTLEAYASFCDPDKLVGYGHMASLGVVLRGAERGRAARGFARDILMYDQGGCLSPHTIFVEGRFDDACDFCDALGKSLGASDMPLVRDLRTARRAARVREAREMARFEEGARLWEDERLRWTVACIHSGGFRFSPTYGVVYVHPFVRDELELLLGSACGKLQGAGVASGRESDMNEVGKLLAKMGVSYTCCPGAMQSPPLQWRENGKEVLCSLIN